MKLGIVKSAVPALTTLVVNKIVGPSPASPPILSSRFAFDLLPAMASTAVPVLIRGGEASVDLVRTGFRLDSINSYAIITALLLNATLRLYTSTPKEIEGGFSKENIAKTFFVFSSAISIICGTYTTVVFSLLGLYSKSALGMGLDSSFLEFFAATAISRKRAFDSFLMALLSFKLCFTTSLYLNYDGKLRWWLVGVATVVGIWSWLHWQTIIHVAGQLLFKR